MSKYREWKHAYVSKSELVIYGNECYRSFWALVPIWNVNYHYLYVVALNVKVQTYVCSNWTHVYLFLLQKTNAMKQIWVYRSKKMLGCYYDYVDGLHKERVNDLFQKDGMKVGKNNITKGWPKEKKWKVTIGLMM